MFNIPAEVTRWLRALQTKIDRIEALIVRDVVPVGGTIPFPGLIAPAGYAICNGAAVSRTTNPVLLSVMTFSLTGTRTSGSPIITSLSSTAEIDVGMKVEGTGIPAGASVLTVDSATQITLTANASSNGTSALTFFPYGNGDGSTTFNVPDTRQRFLLGKAASGTGDKLGATGGAIDHTHAPGTLAADNHGSAAGLILGGAVTYLTSPITHTITGNTDAANPPFVVFNYIIKLG